MGQSSALDVYHSRKSITVECTRTRDYILRLVTTIVQRPNIERSFRHTCSFNQATVVSCRRDPGTSI